MTIFAVLLLYVLVWETRVFVMFVCLCVYKCMRL